MLGNMLTISNPTSIDSDGKFDLLSSSTILRTCPVSLMQHGKSLVKSNKTVSANTDSFAIAVLHSRLITLAGLPTLSVLIKPYILPGGLSLVGLRYDCLLSSIDLFSVYFSNHFSTLKSNSCVGNCRKEVLLT